MTFQSTLEHLAYDLFAWIPCFYISTSEYTKFNIQEQILYLGKVMFYCIGWHFVKELLQMC